MFFPADSRKGDISNGEHQQGGKQKEEIGKVY